jgi:hypothetical protein
LKDLVEGYNFIIRSSSIKIHVRKLREETKSSQNCVTHDLRILGKKNSFNVIHIKRYKLYDTWAM